MPAIRTGEAIDGTRALFDLGKRIVTTAAMWAFGLAFLEQGATVSGWRGLVSAVAAIAFVALGTGMSIALAFSLFGLARSGTGRLVPPGLAGWIALPVFALAAIAVAACIFASSAALFGVLLHLGF